MIVNNETHKPGFVINKGQWVTLCCHLDLYQAEEDEVLNEEDLEWTRWVYNNELEALEDIRKSWPKDSQGHRECSERINKLIEKRG